jgi:predicted naringenin-chalcone synthase
MRKAARSMEAGFSSGLATASGLASSFGFSAGAVSALGASFLGLSTALAASGLGSYFLASTAGFAAVSSLTTCFLAHPEATKAMVTTEIRTTNQTDDFLNIPSASFL